MAGPLRFRYSPQSWNDERVRARLFEPLSDRFGATIGGPWFGPPGGFEARHLQMDNGDFALFLWTDGPPDRTEGAVCADEAPAPNGPRAYWLGNTETPEVLWQTDKYTFAEVPYPVARWAQRELLARLELETPWLAEYEYVSWFFLPVFLSKDGRETTRRFFAEDAAGFPDATREEGLAFYERVLRAGALDDHRYEMAAKLGTSDRFEPDRMRATMAEFTVAKLLTDAGLDFVPEVELGSGHALDFRVASEHLLEVTRPSRPGGRRADTPSAAVRATGRAKGDGQLRAHGDATLLVDCTSFLDDEWTAVRTERPSVGHEPAVVFRARPSGRVEGYRVGRPPVDLDGAISWVAGG